MTEEELVQRLKKLRAGRGLAQPNAILTLGNELKVIVRRVLDGTEPTNSDLTHVGTNLLRAAILLLPDDLRLVAGTELNLTSGNLGASLSKRRSDLATELGNGEKTIIRRGDEALALIAHSIVSRKAESRLAEGRLVPPEDSVRAPESDTSILRGFWGWPSVQHIDILCSEIPEDERPYFANPLDRNYLRYAKFADLDTLIYLRSQLARYLPEATIRDFSPSEYYDSQADELIVVGGPPWNSKYREFQNIMPLFFKSNPDGEDDPLVDGNTSYFPEWLPDGSLKTDVSLFARITLRAAHQQIKLTGGCLTAGVLGAARCFLDQSIAAPNIEWVTERASSSDFVLAFRTAKVGALLDPPLLSDPGMRILFVRNAQGEFERYVE